jgi:ribosomal protein S18 acetylase RimI-like enzyme
MDRHRPGEPHGRGGADNTGALHLYQSLGFTEYGRLKDFVAIGKEAGNTVSVRLNTRIDR